MEVFNFEIADIHFTLQKLNMNETMNYRGEKVVTGTGNPYLRLHQHIVYECFLPLDQFVLNTESGLTTYEASCVVVPPGVKHCVCGEDTYAFYFLMEQVERKKARIYDRFCAIVKDGIWTLPMNEKIRFYSSALKQCDEMESLAGQEPLLLPLLLLEIFSDIFPGEKLKYSPLKSRWDYQILIDNYIITFLHWDVTLEDIASELGLTTRRVQSLVKEYYGCTFTQLLNRRRLQAACSLLENVEMSNSEIAIMAGFENENYFYLCFKNEYEMTPQQYRLLSRKKKK